MKTPEEIRKALDLCVNEEGIGCMKSCPYSGGASGKLCIELIIKDALVYIEQLENEKQQLELKIMGVMHFVDKFLSKEEKELDEIQRTDIMREKVLRLIEKEA